MSKLLLNLRMVPDDESADVRAFLDANDIAWYETQPSRWGISYGGIWLKHDADLVEAKQLMAAYQAQRSATARAEQAQAKRDGTVETFTDVVRQSPLRVLLTLVAIVILLGFVALPIWLLHR